MRGNIILKREGEASWVTYIKKRIDNNLNFLSITTGPTGAGKSLADISIGIQIDPEFDPREQVVFTFGEFMTAIKKFNGQVGDEFYLVEPRVELVTGKTPLHKRKYKIVIFEESQVVVNRREWASKVNKLFQYLISTFRHQNIIVLFNSPYADYFDGATLKMIHAKFEVRGWNKKTQKTHIRAKLLQYNDKLSKFYEHYLQVITNGRVVKFDGDWKVPKPPQEIVKVYEEMKTAFTNKLNARIEREVAKLEEAYEPQDEKEQRKPLTPIQLEVMKTLANIKESNRYEIACKMLGKAGSSIYQSKAQALKKGWTLEEFKDDIV
jgi:hypothetical protein